MTKSEMLIAVKNNLKLQDDTRDLDISDVIFSICDYCNLNPDCFLNCWNQLSGKKSKGSLIMRQSEEPDTSRIYQPSKKAMEVLPMPQAAVTADGIYGLTDADKSSLRRFRRLRGYD